MKLPDDLRRPSGGDTIDSAAQDAIRLAHRALERFPGLVRRHKFLAGGAAVSSALVALAGVAVARRMVRGQSGDDAVATVTEEELEGLRVVPATETDEDAAELDETEEHTVDGTPPLNGSPADVVGDESDGEPTEAPHSA